MVSRHASPHRPNVPWFSAAALVSCATACIGFVVLATIVRFRHGPLGLDRTVVDFVNAQAGTASFSLGEAGSFLGRGPVVGFIALAAGAWVAYRTRRFLLAAAIPAAAALGGVVEFATKHLVARLRPPTATLTGEGGYGFPSGHTAGHTAMAAAVVAVLCVLAFRRRDVLVAGTTAVATSALVGLGRVLVGAHWTTDVIGGLLLGFAAGIATVQLATLAEGAWAGRAAVSEPDERAAPSQRGGGAAAP